MKKKRKKRKKTKKSRGLASNSRVTRHQEVPVCSLSFLCACVWMCLCVQSGLKRRIKSGANPAKDGWSFTFVFFSLSLLAFFWIFIFLLFFAFACYAGRCITANIVPGDQKEILVKTKRSSLSSERVLSVATTIEEKINKKQENVATLQG